MRGARVIVEVWTRGGGSDRVRGSASGDDSWYKCRSLETEREVTAHFIRENHFVLWTTPNTENREREREIPHKLSCIHKELYTLQRVHVYTRNVKRKISSPKKQQQAGNSANVVYLADHKRNRRYQLGKSE